MHKLRITLLVLAAFLLAGVWSVTSAPTANASTAAITATAVTEPCWHYEIPPEGCSDEQNAGGGSQNDPTAGDGYPQNVNIFGSYKGNNGVGGGVYEGNGQYHGAFYGSGGCFVEFHFEMSWWDVLVYLSGGRVPLSISVIQENGCN